MNDSLRTDEFCGTTRDPISFSRIVIVGVGLMGGSVGLAAKQRGIARTVVGIEPCRDRLDTALERGIVDTGATDLREGLLLDDRGPDPHLPELIVIGTPVGQVVRTASEIMTLLRRRRCRPNVLITDLGSTKETICDRLNKLDEGPFHRGCRFIGSHPIAGKERSGPENAEGDLFEKRLTVLSPSSSICDLDVGRLSSFWRRLGSAVVCVSPEEHDRILARTSHLPHLLSAMLAEMLQDGDRPYTGSGFRSTTRLASGIPSLWRDIVSNNPKAILEAIRRFEAGLAALREDIENENWDGLALFLESAKRSRDILEA